MWTASKDRKAMNVNGKTLIVPSTVQAIPAKGLINKPLFKLDSIPLNLDSKHEDLRSYHARLDLKQSIIGPDQSDLDWQVENIVDWRWNSKGFDKEKPYL